MRHSPIYALLLIASCAPPSEENKTDGGAGGEGPAATVTAVSNAGQGCSIRWNGEAVSKEGLLDNSVRLIMRAIEDIGGIDKVTGENLPYLRLEAAGDVPYSCTGPVLREMQRAGFSHAALKLAEGPARDQRADFPLEPVGPSQNHAIFRLEKSGRMTWDGVAVDRVGLKEKARLARSIAPQVEFSVAPSPDSDFKALYDALRAIEEEKLTAVLAGCAGTPGPVWDLSPPC